jgi:hypothetical protein
MEKKSLEEILNKANAEIDHWKGKHNDVHL